MSGAPEAVARCMPVGSYRGVALEVAVWDAVGAEVDLSCACMFMRELGEGMGGGLNHLNQSLSGALVDLRARGVFRGEAMETLSLTPPLGVIRARRLLVIGLGDPTEWHADLMERATRCAIGEAQLRGAHSAGIAPSLLDSGLLATSTAAGSAAMMRGVIRGIDAANVLGDLGLARRFSLSRWTFAAGAAHAAGAVSLFRTLFKTIAH